MNDYEVKEHLIETDGIIFENQIEIKSSGERGSGGAFSTYLIKCGLQEPQVIKFQEGTMRESKVNGLSNESLLAVIIDRLEAFQAGEFACDENAEALRWARAALRVMKQRTIDRIKRGVEGKELP